MITESRRGRAGTKRSAGSAFSPPFGRALAWTLSLVLALAGMAAAPATTAAATATDAASAASAASAAAGRAPVETPYALTDRIDAGVKSVVNERVDGGTRLGAVVRLRNRSDKPAVVPDYELRVVTAEGVSYTLAPSASNPAAVLPRETVEASYMATVGRSDAFALDRLAWVSVDPYVYPKRETTVVSAPIGAIAWNGLDTTFADAARRKAWGEPFRLPVGSPDVVYTTVALAQGNEARGEPTVVSIRAENRSGRTEWIETFDVVGHAGTIRRRAERPPSADAALAPGEARTLRFALPPASGAWSRLTVTTPETFVGADGTPVEYAVGRLQIDVPASAAEPLRGAAYELSAPVRLEPSSPLAASGVAVAVVEWERFDLRGDGYATAVAKLVLTNRGAAAVPLPDVELEWTAADGDAYAGRRQATALQSLPPNIGVALNYAFTVPVAETAERGVLRLYQRTEGEPAPRAPVAALAMELGAKRVAEAAALYPFAIEFDSWSLSRRFSGADGTIGTSEATYTYELTWNASVARASNVAVDAAAVRLRVELADATGRPFATADVPLAGRGRIADGEQTIAFRDVPAGPQTSGVRVRLYETFDTVEGEQIERLVAELR